MTDIDIAALRSELATFDRLSSKHCGEVLDEIERLRGALAIMTETIHDAVEEFGGLNDAVSESLPEVSCDAEGHPGNAIERIQWAGDRLAALERVRETGEEAYEWIDAMHSDGDYPCAAIYKGKACTCGAQPGIDARERFRAALDAAEEKP